MPAGDLDTPITLQSRAGGFDSFGQPSTTWTDYAKVWAQQVPIGGTERVEAQQRLNREIKRLRIRWRAGVSAAHRVIWDGATFEITGVREEGRRKYLVLDVFVINQVSGSA